MAPTLVITGDEDSLVTVDEVKGMVALIPNSKFLVFPGAGHLFKSKRPTVSVPQS